MNNTLDMNNLNVMLEVLIVNISYFKYEQHFYAL